MKKFVRNFAAVAMIFACAAASSCSGEGKSGENSGDATEQAAPEKKMTAKQERQLKGLEKELANVNKQLPMKLPNGLVMQKMELKDGYVVTTGTYSPEDEIEILNTPEGKAQLVKQIGSTRDRLKELGLGVKYIYKEDGTGKEDVITIEPEEL